MILRMAVFRIKNVNDTEDSSIQNKNIKMFKKKRIKTKF